MNSDTRPELNVDDTPSWMQKLGFELVQTPHTGRSYGRLFRIYVNPFLNS